MLNYNYNLEYTLRGKSHFNTGSYNWSFVERTVTAANPNGIPTAFATMSIYWNPFNPDYIAISGSGQTGSLQGGQKIGFPLLTSLTGSGVWPTTGSNQLSILITNNQGAYTGSSLLLSAAAGNMNLSGSKISASFTSYDNKAVDIIGQVIHTKGNIYNPTVYWQTINNSPVITNDLVNGYSSSFNIVKNVTQSLANVNDVTSSLTGSVQNQYAFNITSSLTASINNVTGSTTMSINIPEANISSSQTFFNPTTTTAILTASFVAAQDTPYYLTATVTYNKGNISNSNIGWSASGSQNGYNTAVTSSFTIVKDANVSLITANPLVPTASNFTNQYAFNITASISSSVKNYYASDSSSYYLAKATLVIPEIGIDLYSWNSSSLLTGSFAARTDIQNYSITGSVNSYSTPVIDYLVVAGGGGGANYSNAQDYNSFAGGGGAGGLLTGSSYLIPYTSYPVIIGAGGIYAGGDCAIGCKGGNGQTSSFNGVAPIGGGGGGFYVGSQHNGLTGSNGGSGGAYNGLGIAGQGTDGADNLLGGGLSYTWLNGIVYAGGGGGVGLNASGYTYYEPHAIGLIGGGGNGNNITAGGGTGNGASGSVVIRYKATGSRATGGTVSITGSYVYHTFTSNGSFTITN